MSDSAMFDQVVANLRELRGEMLGATGHSAGVLHAWLVQSWADKIDTAIADLLEVERRARYAEVLAVGDALVDVAIEGPSLVAERRQRSEPDACQNLVKRCHRRLECRLVGCQTLGGRYGRLWSTLRPQRRARRGAAFVEHAPFRASAIEWRARRSEEGLSGCGTVGVFARVAEEPSPVRCGKWLGSARPPAVEWYTFNCSAEIGGEK